MYLEKVESVYLDPEIDLDILQVQQYVLQLEDMYRMVLYLNAAVHCTVYTYFQSVQLCNTIENNHKIMYNLIFEGIESLPQTQIF